MLSQERGKGREKDSQKVNKKEGTENQNSST
jgi:hypothetical protein